MRLLNIFRRGKRDDGPPDVSVTSDDGLPVRKILKERLPIREFESFDSGPVDYALRFWFDNRQGDSVPGWSSFRPEQHPSLLPHVILYESREGRFFTRIVGDTVGTYVSEKQMGKYLDEVVTRDTLDDVVMRLDRSLSDGLPNYVEKMRLWQDDSELYGYNALSMPFGASDGGPDRVLCVFNFNTEFLPT